METIGAVLAWMFFGLVVGAVARLLYPGRQAIGMIGTMLLGIAGSLVGGFISWAVAGGPEGAFQGAGWIMSIVGALIVVFGFLAMSGGRRTV